MPPSPVIAARNVVRRYGERRALDDFTLDIPEGTVFGLLGPNGSGKSTFIALVAAMESPDSGSYEVFGTGPERTVRARLGTVFQENASDPLMTPVEYLRFAARLFGVPAGTRNTRIPRMLEQFGLAQRSNDPIGQLSGGMRRRLEAARALIHEPQLLLLDEPTTGVDPEERKALWDTVLSMREGRTIVVATNDLPEADAVCDRVAFIQGGKVVASGTPAELKAGLRKESVRITWPEPSADELARVGALAGVGQITPLPEGVLVTVDDAAAFVPRLFEIAGAAIRGVAIEPATLADAYFQHVRPRLAVAQ